MQCPKCKAEMEKKSFQNIEVDRCTGCGGLWFDMMEAENLKTLQGSEKLDTAPLRADSLDEHRDIACPVCKTRMIQMVDKSHPKLRYEGCPTCYGVFFDAGEFREFKAETVMERFWRVLTHPVS
jgi:Zn-finger nucleic acid-binding protein